MNNDWMGVVNTEGLNAAQAAQVLEQFYRCVLQMDTQPVKLEAKGAGKVSLMVDPRVANPFIMNSSLQIASFLEGRPELVRGKTVTDMGTGSGVIGIMAAKLGAKKVYMPEIDPRAVICARRNVWRNRTSRTCTVFQSDLFESRRWRSCRPADVHIFNHPFFAIEPDLLIPGNDWLRMMLGGTELLGRYFATAAHHAHPESIYILPWLPLAGNEGLDNDPGKRGPEHGFEVMEKLEIPWVGIGSQESSFYIYILQKRGNGT